MLTKNQIRDLLFKLKEDQYPQGYILQSGKRIDQEEYLEVVIDFLTKVWEGIPQPRETNTPQ